MSHRARTEEDGVTMACFVCSEGCIHLEYANLMLTLTQKQFLSLSTIVAETRQRLMQEQAKTIEEIGQRSGLLM